MTDIWKSLIGPGLTLVITLVGVALYFGGLKADVAALKEQSKVSKEDHDTVIRMSTDIDYIKQALTRIESAVGAQQKAASNER